MRKIIVGFLTAGLVLSLSACEKETDTPTELPTTMPTETAVPETTEASVPVQIDQQPMAAITLPVVREDRTAEDGTTIFTYEYQNVSLILHEHAIADKVVVNLLNQIDATRIPSEALAKMAAENYDGSQSWTPYLSRMIYEPTRIDQSVLSMFGHMTAYSGGVHPEHTNMSASYDLTTGDPLTLAGILQIGASTHSLRDLLKEQLRKSADQLQLYSDFEDTVDRRFASDPSQDEAFFFTGTGLCFYFAPYEIAPYAAGTVTAEIPYSMLAGILHDSYFPAEKLETTSSLSMTNFSPEESKKYTQIAEVILNPEGGMYLIHTDNLVHDVKISQSLETGEKSVLFAAQALTPGDAIMLQVDPVQTPSLIISYENSSGIQTLIPRF